MMVMLMRLVLPEQLTFVSSDQPNHLETLIHNDASKRTVRTAT